MMISIPGIVSQGGGISFPIPGKALNDYTWEEISLVSSAGMAADYFSVGDRKGVTLNGTVGSLTFSNETYYCEIIGINHNESVEGTNRIHFQFGYSAVSGGVPLAFCDSGYATQYSSDSWFNMNTSNTNSGGWASSKMRNVTCPEFKNTMPSDLKAVIKSVTKYSDNNGGVYDQKDYVTATTDDIFLLSEFEVNGTSNFASNYEKAYQARYELYAKNNYKLKFKHRDSGTGVIWYFRSTQRSGDKAFCCVNASDYVTYSNASFSRGFVPCFCV